MQKLDKDVQAFLDKHDTIVYISFGSTFIPKDEHVLILAEVIKTMPEVGFIWSYKGHLFD